MNEQSDILNAIPELEGDIPASRFVEMGMWIPLLCGLAALVLLIGLFLLVRRLRRKPLPAPPSEEYLAMQSLQQVEEALPPLRECSLRLSLILRRFLTGQTQDPALFETHEEFSQRLDALATVPEECQCQTRFLLEGLADLKYSGNEEQDPVRARNFIEQTRSLIGDIARAQRRQAEERTAKGKTLS